MSSHYCAPVNQWQQFLSPHATDVIPPAIVEAFVDQIGAASARINVVTANMARVQVHYGTNPAIDNGSIKDAGNLGSYSALFNTADYLHHDLVISGLLENTNYYFQIITAEGPISVPMWTPGTEVRGNNPGIGAELYDKVLYTFATSDDPFPQISNLVVDPSTTGAVFQFTTSENCLSQVEWGTVVGVYPNTTGMLGPNGTSHTRTLTLLNHSTMYFFRIGVQDSIGQITFLTGSFTTDVDPPPGISNISHSNIQRTQAQITCNTSEPCTVRVEYGTISGSWPNATSQTSSGTSHSRTLSSLTPGTTYFYRVRAIDSVGQITFSGQGAFTTVPNPSFVGAGSANNGAGGTTVTVPISGASQTGDVLIAGIACENGTLNTPSGWTKIVETENGMRLALYRRNWQSGLNSQQFSASSSGRMLGGIATYRGINQGDPVEDTATENATDTQMNCGSVSVPSPGLVLYVGAVDANEGMTNKASGYTERYQPRSTRNIMSADRQTSGGSENPGFQIGTSIARLLCGISCSLNPAP